MVTHERVPGSRRMSYRLNVFGWLLVILGIYGFVLGPAVGSSPTKNFVISEIGISGNQIGAQICADGGKFASAYVVQGGRRNGQKKAYGQGDQGSEPQLGSGGIASQSEMQPGKNRYQQQ